MSGNSRTQKQKREINIKRSFTVVKLLSRSIKIFKINIQVPGGRIRRPSSYIRCILR